MEKKFDDNYTRMLRAVLNKPWRQHPTKQQLYGLYHPSQKPFKLDKLDMQDTAREVRTNSLAMYSSGPIHMDEQKLDDQLEPINSNSVPIQDVAWKTCWERWMIGTSGERGSGRSVLAVWHDDDDLLMDVWFLRWEVSGRTTEVLLPEFIENST